MRNARLTVIELNAKKIARRYRRRVWWISLEDLEQEARCAQLAAERTFDREKGAFGGYAWRAAVIACHRYVLAQSSPVSCRQDPSKMLGMYRAELEDDSALTEATVDEALDSARRDSRVRDRLKEILGKGSVDFAVGMLSREYTPGEVAADHDVPEQRVYRAVRSVRDRVAGDQVLFDLWRDS